MGNRGNNSRTSTRKNSASTKRSYEENKRKIKKKKKGKKAFIIILIFLIIGVLASGCYLLFTSSTFDVSEVELNGTERYTKVLIFLLVRIYLLSSLVITKRILINFHI